MKVVVKNIKAQRAPRPSPLSKMEAVRAAATLPNKGAWLQRIFDSMSISVCLLSTDGIVIDVNNTAVERVSLNRDDVIGKDLAETYWWSYSPLGQTQLRDAIRRAAQGNTVRYDAVIRMGEHQFNTVDVTFGPLYNAAGQVVQLTGSAVDITVRSQAENALRRSENKYRGLVETAPDGMVIVDAKGNIEIINQQLERMTGYTRDDLKGQPIEVLVPKRFKGHKQKRDGYLKDPSPRLMGSGLTLYVQRKDGSEFPAEISLSSMETRDGPSVSAAIRDISERMQAADDLNKSEAMLAEAQRIAHVGSWEFDILANRRMWSDEMCRILEVESAQSVDSYEAYLEIVHPDDRALFDELYVDVINEKKPNFDFEHRLMMKDGRVKHIHQIAENIFDQNGELIRSIETIFDITERKHTEEELLKLSRAVEAASSAVIITDIDGNIEYVNPKFSEITGYTREEAIGKNPRLLQSGETPKAVNTELWKTIAAGGEWKGEFHNREKDGSVYWSRTSISGVKDVTGKITHFVSIQEDVTHEYELSEQLRYQANHDALTGLINRAEFERRAERLLTSVRQDKTEHALCFMDLDQFKVVNDTCGHMAGDELLSQLGAVLQNTVRHRDSLARLGGDEFGVLMEHCSLEHACQVAASLQGAVQDYRFIWDGHVFKVGVSVGLVAINEAVPNLTELLKQADAACYMAKDLGRNRIHVYHPEDIEIARRHGEMQWVTRLHQALEEDRFCLYAYELLLRMIDEHGRIIAPGAFLPAAERYNLIERLDRWVIENAFTLLVENPVFLGKISFISLNLSSQSLTKPGFSNFIISVLDKSGIDGEKICFEIIETAAIANLSAARKFISSLKALGCRFALDDFGSGLSSFAYLKNLPADYLKIDGMFVKNIVDDPIDGAMVKSINEIAHVMGKKTIAEFVENDAIKEMLREIGVNYAQGYGIGKPLPFCDLLANRQRAEIRETARELRVGSARI